MSKLLAGNANAFSRLVEKYQKPVFSLAFRLLGNRTVAEDVAQETFLRAYKCLGRFEQESQFSSWLFAIANNSCMDILRKRGFKTKVQLEEDILIRPVEDDENPAKIYETTEMHLTIQQAVKNLPPKYQLIVLMKYMNEMSYKEISEVLKI